jgi:hypothetical protein
MTDSQTVVHLVYDRLLNEIIRTSQNETETKLFIEKLIQADIKNTINSKTMQLLELTQTVSTDDIVEKRKRLEEDIHLNENELLLSLKAPYGTKPLTFFMEGKPYVRYCLYYIALEADTKIKLPERYNK